MDIEGLVNMIKEESQVKDILKALGHQIRRDVIRVIDDNNGPTSFSYLLNTLDLPTSSNIAYHLKILTNSKLIDKNHDGDYSLTKDGKKSMLLFEDTKSSSLSKISEIGRRFGKLSPLHVILVSWWFFFLFTGFVLIQFSLILGILLVALGILVISMVLYRMRSILLSLTFIQTLIWIYFLRKNRILVLIMNVTSLFSGGFLVGTVTLMNDYQVPSPIKEFIGLILLTISLLSTLMYIAFSYKNKN